MTTGRPVLRRGLLGVAAGVVASGLVAIQAQESLPAVRTYALVLAPVPLVVAALRGGGVGAAASLGVCALVLGTTSVGEEVPAWAFLVGYGAIVLLVLVALRSAPGMNALMIGGLCVAALLASVHLLVKAQRHGRTVRNEYQEMIRENMAQLTEGLASAHMEAARREQFERALPAATALIPTVLVGRYASGLALGCMATVFVVRRWRLSEAPPFDFAAWRLPEWFVFCFIAPAAVVLMGLVRDWPTATFVAGNVLAGVVLLYLAQGCAIVHAFLRRFRVHPAVEAILFVSMVVVLPPLLVMVTVGGLFDFLVDFRGRWMPGPPATDGPPQDG